MKCPLSWAMNAAFNVMCHRSAGAILSRRSIAANGFVMAGQ